MDSSGIMGNLANGVQLMLIGMVTVFVILTIVIYGSKLLIGIINKFSSENHETEQAAESAGDRHRAILEAAVAQITAGKGTITRITEI